MPISQSELRLAAAQTRFFLEHRDGSLRGSPKGTPIWFNTKPDAKKYITDNKVKDAKIVELPAVSRRHAYLGMVPAEYVPDRNLIWRKAITSSIIAGLVKLIKP